MSVTYYQRPDSAVRRANQCRAGLAASLAEMREELGLLERQSLKAQQRASSAAVTRTKQINISDSILSTSGSNLQKNKLPPMLVDEVNKIPTQTDTLTEKDDVDNKKEASTPPPTSAVVVQEEEEEMFSFLPRKASEVIARRRSSRAERLAVRRESKTHENKLLAASILSPIKEGLDIVATVIDSVNQAERSLRSCSLATQGALAPLLQRFEWIKPSAGMTLPRIISSSNLKISREMGWDLLSCTLLHQLGQGMYPCNVC